MFDFDRVPKVRFSRSSKRETTLCVELYTEYALWKDMQRAEKEEDYEQAIIYRNELVRRGKLEPRTDFSP
jgi:hypothetical protein